jgi:hypothetical protein
MLEKFCYDRNLLEEDSNQYFADGKIFVIIPASKLITIPRGGGPQKVIFYDLMYLNGFL